MIPPLGGGGQEFDSPLGPRFFFAWSLGLLLGSWMRQVLLKSGRVVRSYDPFSVVCFFFFSLLLLLKKKKKKGQ